MVALPMWKYHLPIDAQRLELVKFMVYLIMHAARSEQKVVPVAISVTVYDQRPFKRMFVTTTRLN